MLSHDQNHMETGQTVSACWRNQLPWLTMLCPYGIARDGSRALVRRGPWASGDFSAQTNREVPPAIRSKAFSGELMPTEAELGSRGGKDLRKGGGAFRARKRRLHHGAGRTRNAADAAELSRALASEAQRGGWQCDGFPSCSGAR